MAPITNAIVCLLLIISQQCANTFGASIVPRQASPSTTELVTSPATEISPNVPSLSFDDDANHLITVNKQNEVLALGQSISLGITNALVRPLVFFNNKVSQVASTLPGLMAANGAVLGTAIATPIQLGTLAANNLAAGVTGTLVSIPISLVSGGTAQLIGVVETGRQIYQGKVAAITETVRQNLPALMRPLTVIGGANSVVSGIALSTLANGAKRIGQGVEQIGSSISNAGQGISNAGSTLTFWGNGQPIEVVAELSSQDQVNTQTTTIATLSDLIQTDFPVQPEITTQVSETTPLVLFVVPTTTTESNVDTKEAFTTEVSTLSSSSTSTLFETSQSPICCSTEINQVNLSNNFE